MSTEEQAAGHSLEGQYRDCRLYCDKQEYRVVRHYSETGSGRDPGRPTLQRLLDHAVQGRFDVLVVWRRDRWGRSAAWNPLLERMLGEAGVVLETVNQGKPDKSDEGELLTAMLDAFSEYEAKKIATRCEMGKRTMARAGFWPRKAPFGYRKNAESGRIELEPAAAAVVRSALEQLALGVSLHQVSNRTGLGYERIRYWLWNPCYEGTLQYADVRVPDAWPPIVPADVLERARGLAKARHDEKGNPRASASCPGPRRGSPATPQHATPGS